MEHAPNVGEGAERTALVRTIMRRQARLGLSVAAVFILILAGLPLLNYFVPETMATHVGGFPLTWLLLAVLFYPVTWLLSWAFVRGSDRIEARIVTEMRSRIETIAERGGRSADPALEESTPSGAPIPPPTTKRKLFVEEDGE